MTREFTAADLRFDRRAADTERMTDYTPKIKFEELDDNTTRLTITEPALDEVARKAIRGLHEQKEAALADALKSIGWTSPDDLAAHDRKIAAEAWDEGHDAGQVNEHEYRPRRKMTNPYRADRIEQEGQG